ncbi:Mce family protein Mce4 [Mycobacterium tuberculosis variant africanum]|nr:Mce family protein Mce4 [Mycobacterium tuberculosis variant africanum]
MTGFLPPPLVRSPADESVREIPRDMYCKTAQNDPSTVRGARNYPCQEFPGKRAPTVQLCRDPRGYVPVGTNPWRGPPIPYGTEVTDGRNILPPNKFPYIPPGADPDPGVPIVGPPPPGQVAGPGRRRTSRRSLRRRPTTTVRLHRSRHGCRPGTRRSHPRCHTRRPFRRRHHRKAPGLRPGRRLAPNRRPAVRPTPSMTNSAEPSRTRPAALVSSRPG